MKTGYKGCQSVSYISQSQTTYENGFPLIYGIYVCVGIHICGKHTNINFPSSKLHVGKKYNPTTF